MKNTVHMGRGDRDRGSVSKSLYLPLSFTVNPETALNIKFK